MSHIRGVLQAVAVLIVVAGGSAHTVSMTESFGTPPGGNAHAPSSSAPFGFHSFGWMSAACLPFRRRLTTTNGLAFRPAQTNGYRSREVPGPPVTAIEQGKSGRANAVLMEIGFPGMSGADGIRLLMSMCPQAEFRVLAVNGEDQRAPWPAVPKPSVEWPAAAAPNATEPGDPAGTPDYKLTRQEARVLRLLGEGHHYKTAAADLGISTNTISYHLRRIYDKLQVHSKSEAIAKAFRDGVLR